MYFNFLIYPLFLLNFQEALTYEVSYAFIFDAPEHVATGELTCKHFQRCMTEFHDGEDNSYQLILADWQDHVRIRIYGYGEYRCCSFSGGRGWTFIQLDETFTNDTVMASKYPDVRRSLALPHLKVLGRLSVIIQK